MITGIIVALPDELSTLTPRKIKRGQSHFINAHTIIAVAGAGAENAARASQLLIEQGAETLISWGCAAALSPNLTPGDLVLPHILHTPSHYQIAIDSPWLQTTIKTLESLNPVTDSLVSSDKLITTSAEKKALHQQTKAVALDMESAAIANIAKQHNYPVLVIRTIADPASMDLPASVSYALNQQGDVVLLKLLGYLLTHPNELPKLIKLGLHFKSATNKLKLVAKRLDIIVGFESKTA